MTMALLLEHFDGLLATPEDVKQLNRVILQLAVRGKLVLQNPNDETATDLLKRISVNNLKTFIPVQDNEKLFDLPSGWEWARLLDICTLQTGKKDVNEGNLNGKYPFFTCAYKPTLSDTYSFEGKYLILPGNGANVGMVFLFDGKFEAYQRTYLLGDFSVYEEYIYYLLQGLWEEHLKGKQSGSAINYIKLGNFERFVLPLPPLAEQKRIVARVEELFAQTDALAKELAHSQSELGGLNKSALSHLLASETPEEFNQHWDFIAEHFDLLFQVPEHVAPLRQSILELAVRGKLTRREAGDKSAGELLKSVQDEKVKLIEEGKLKKEKPLPPIEEDEKNFELPMGWEWVRLGDISKSSDYGTSEKASEVDQVPILRMNNIQSGRVLLENLKYVPASLEELPKLYLKNGDLLFNRTNSYELVGKTGIFKGEDDKYTFASYLIRVSFFQNFVNIDYINSYFNSDVCRLTQIEPHITQQTGQANFNGTKLKNIVIPLPSLAEQERIVKRVEQLLSLCDALEARLQSAEDERGKLVAAVMSTVGG